MGKSNIRIKVVIGIASIFLLGCKKEIEIVTPITEVEIKIEKSEGQLLSGAVIGIYDSESKFQNAYITQSLNQALKTDTSDALGNVEFKDLESNKRYFFVAFFEDKSSYSGYSIHWDNSEEEFYFVDNLIEGSKSYGKIKLKPQEGIVGFYTSSANALKLPIKLALNKDSIGSLSTTTNNVPSAFSSQAVWRKLKKGLASYSAKSDGGCSWIDTINVKAGQLVFRSLDACNVGTFSFGVLAKYQAALPITVVLNQTDTIGTINDISANTNVSCKPTNAISIQRGAGSYVYSAFSNKQGTVWSGKISVKADSCNVLYLP